MDRLHKKMPLFTSKCAHELIINHVFVLRKLSGRRKQNCPATTTQNHEDDGDGDDVDDEDRVAAAKEFRKFDTNKKPRAIFLIRCKKKKKTSLMPATLLLLVERLVRPRQTDIDKTSNGL